MAQATKAVEAASSKQGQVPELLGNAARSVGDLYAALKELESRRQDAMQSLAIVDRVDYEIELEDGEEHERSLDRDPRGLAYALASRHGDGRVRKLLDELQPGFGPMQGCNMDDALTRDVARFVTERVTPAAAPIAAAKSATSSRFDNGGAPAAHPVALEQVEPAPQLAPEVPALLVDPDQD